MNFTIDGDPASWDERSWIDAFRAAISTKDGFPRLRATVFSHTALAVKRGGYRVDGEAVSLVRPKSIGMNTTFYTQPPKLSRTRALRRDRTRFAVQNADCVEVAQVLLCAGFRPAVLNMATCVGTSTLGLNHMKGRLMGRRKSFTSMMFDNYIANARLGAMWIETMAASGDVIAKRVDHFANVTAPLSGGDRNELRTMITEKVEAATDATRRVSEAFAANPALLASQWSGWLMAQQRLATAVTALSLARTPSQMAARSRAVSSAMVRATAAAAVAATSGSRVSTKALRPFHARAKANAKRLRRAG